MNGSVLSLTRMKPTIMGAMLALVACASSGENTRTKVGAGAGAATGAVVGRAEAVRRVLVDRGIPEKRALAIGMGEAQPVAANDSPGGRAKNRRVELRIAMAKQ